MFKRSLMLLCFLAVFSLYFSLSCGAIEGYCGENVSYVYDSSTASVLISGEGDMYDYVDASYSPFYLTDIVTVEIADGVTSIGDNAFFGCESLEIISIPDSAQSIGSKAFESCCSLSEILLPEALTYIGNNAFMGCESLTEIVLPTGITYISESAFEYCDNLSSVIFLGDVEGVASNAFRGCKNLSEVHFNSAIEDIAETVIENFPSREVIHGTTYKETVKDCLTGETVISFYCNTCDNYVYLKEIIMQYNAHTFGQYTSDNNYSCLLDGTKTATCSRCGKTDTVTDVGSSQGHSWNDWETTIPATCITEGEKSRGCFNCDVFETETIPAFSHKNSYTVKENSPTCTANGYAEGVFCPDCQIWISGHSLLLASGHSGGVADCRRKAVCSKCGEEYGNFNPQKHINITILPGSYATCTNDGYTQSKVCCDCETVIEAKTVIKAQGHSEIVIPAIGATCIKDGTTEGIKCSVCDTMIKSPEKITAKGHKVITVPGSEATCTKAGLSEGKKCSSCAEMIVKQNRIPAKTHNYKTITAKKATLTSDGKTVEKCSCGAVKANSEKVVYSPKTFTLSSTAYTYNANTKTPSVSVKDSKGHILKKDIDYIIKYESGRKVPGRYTVTITFTDKYSGTKKLNFTIAPKVTGKVTASQTASSITLKWNMVTGADGYRVYKYNTKTKKYEKVKDVTDRSIKVTGLNSGATYKFKVKAYRKDDVTIWGKATAAYAFSTKPAAPGKISFSKTDSSVTLKWKKVAGASGYAIYRYSSGEWKRIETINSGSKLSCKIERLKSGTNYKFRIKAFRKAGDSTLWSSASDSVTVLTNPGTPALKVSSNKKGAATLKWSNVSGESGYQVYYSTKKDGSFKKLITSKADITKLTKSNLTSGKKYYFKVRSYKKTADGTFYSSWSSVCAVKIK